MSVWRFGQSGGGFPAHENSGIREDGVIFVVEEGTGFAPVSPTLVEIGGPAGSVPDVNEVSRVSGLPVGQVMEAEPTDGGSDGVASADELQLGSGHGRHLSFPGHVAKEGEGEIRGIIALNEEALIRENDVVVCREEGATLGPLEGGIDEVSGPTVAIPEVDFIGAGKVGVSRAKSEEAADGLGPAE